MAAITDFFALEPYLLERLQLLDDPEGSLVFKSTADASGMTRNSLSTKPTFVVAHLESKRLDSKPGVLLVQQRWGIHLLNRGAVKEGHSDGVLLLKAMQLFMSPWTPDVQVWSPLVIEDAPTSDYPDNVREHLFVVSTTFTIRG